MYFFNSSLIANWIAMGKLYVFLSTVTHGTCDASDAFKSQTQSVWRYQATLTSATLWCTN
jgi:hypothetical protein